MRQFLIFLRSLFRSTGNPRSITNFNHDTDDEDQELNDFLDMEEDLDDDD